VLLVLEEGSASIANTSRVGVPTMDLVEADDDADDDSDDASRDGAK